MNRLLIFAWILLCASASATNYHVNFATGNDANSGLTDLLAWKHVPGMLGSTVAVTPAPGDTVLLDSGTWDKTCFPFVPAFAGSSGSPITVTTNGGALAIWDSQGKTIDSMASSKFADLNSASHTRWIGICTSNLNWNTTFTVSGWNFGNASDVVMSNCTFLCYSNLNAGPGSDSLDVVYDASWDSGMATGNRLTYCLFDCAPATAISGQCVYYMHCVDHCTFRNVPNGCVGEFLCLSNNLFVNIQHSVDTAQHENVMEPLGNQQGLPFFVTRNVASNCPAGEICDITPGNNCSAVISDLLELGNTTHTAAIVADGSSTNALGPNSRGTLTIFNVTCQDNDPIKTGFVRVVDRALNVQWANINVTNCLFITENTGGAVQADTGNTTVIHQPAPNTPGANRQINNAAAAAYGFTSVNGLQPPAGSPTRGNGVSMAAFCAALGIPWVDRLGVAFILDSSAYQFSGGGPPVSGLNISGGGTINITTGGQLNITH